MNRLREHTVAKWKGIISEFGMDMYTLLNLKQITNKDILYSTWNTAQCYVAEYFHCLPENYHNTVNWLYPNTKLKVLKKMTVMVVLRSRV